MSNTTITPVVGAATLAGVALALALAITPVQGGAYLNGVAPTSTGGETAPYGFLPVSWSGLGAAAVGSATPAMLIMQARLVVSGVFGDYGNLVIEGSPDGSTWSPLAVVGDATDPGIPLAAQAGLVVTTQADGVVFISQTDLTAGPIKYLRPTVTGGDGTTSLSVAGNLSSAGAV